MTGKQPGQRRLALEVEFAATVRSVPAGARPGLKAWLRRWRRHGKRVFWMMDPARGGWRRV